ncbi:MAG: hypothetical protein H0U49_01810 [Parachlamydiaceae bacterium]|nr:hypothetical protein [Parachlamydiaceae bacterium]
MTKLTLPKQNFQSNVLQPTLHTPFFVSEATKNGVYKSSEEFVRAIEFIEYKGLIRAKAVAQAINKEKGHFFRPYITCECEHIPIDRIGFNLFYSFFISDDHKEHNRNNWRIVNKAYNISIRENSNCESTNKEWFKKGLKVSLLGCGIIAGACAALINFNRLLNEITK